MFMECLVVVVMYFKWDSQSFLESVNSSMSDGGLLLHANLIHAK